MIMLWQQMHCLLREEDGATMLRLASHEKKTIWVHPRRLGLMSTSPWLGGECHFACYGNDQVLRHQLVPFTKFIYWNGIHADTVLNLLDSSTLGNYSGPPTNIQH
ncbi:uncharacterized protein LOC131253229 isoform X2 [Magnolia sinica]|uniref:uncharacterized protein LOC131253229 isoform X2 n=1 Tax=Magnolia sinica TaxID=86752 RepID=UPI00265990BD|nr:uncharacterized protein LOC131253229 isoform X2 [Magnolia sinica]